MVVVGRVLFSTVIERLNQRLASALSFLSQATARAIIINSRNEALVFFACALFGFSVGNRITLPALIVQRELSARSFGVLVSLITAATQVTYAFGPGIVGWLRDLFGQLRRAVLCLHGVAGGRGSVDQGAGAEEQSSNLVVRRREAPSRNHELLGTSFETPREGARLLRTRTELKRLPLLQQLLNIQPPA